MTDEPSIASRSLPNGEDDDGSGMHIRIRHPIEVAPLAVSPRQACQMLSVGLTRMYQLLNANELDSFLLGRSRRITTASIYKLIDRRLAEDPLPESQTGRQ
jgi:hypothetical protein